MNKYFLVPLIILLIISIAANIFSFGQLKKYDPINEQKYIKQIEEKEQKISDLETQLSEANKQDLESSEGVNEQSLSEQSEQVKEQTKTHLALVNAATRFVEYVYNMTPENYVDLKNNAHNYMSDELVNVLFGSPGLDENASDMRTSVDEISVYTIADNNEQAIVHFTSNTEIISSNFVEEKEVFLLLYFDEMDGVLKVKYIKPINDMGGI